MSPKNHSASSMKQQVQTIIGYGRRYSFLLFILFVAALYAFLVTRINTISSTEPTDEAVSSQVKAAKSPHIDQSVVDKLQSLRDNSVSVETLFNDNRSNPFN